MNGYKSLLSKTARSRLVPTRNDAGLGRIMAGFQNRAPFVLSKIRRTPALPEVVRWDLAGLQTVRRAMYVDRDG